MNAVAEKYKDDSGIFDYYAALAPHANMHSAEYNAVSFSLAGDEDEKSADNVSLINAQKAAKTRIHHAFMEQVYNQARYAMICCSGSSAPRLYGMWTGSGIPLGAPSIHSTLT